MSYLGQAIPRSNATEVLALVAQKLSTLEKELVDVGVIEVQQANEYLLGHRLAKAEQALQQLQVQDEEVLLPMDAAWVLTCATLVFLMQLGFAQLESGMCRPKNVIATYMKNIIDYVLGAFCTLVGGYAIAYPQRPIIDQIEAWKFFFHLVFQATASTIVSGAMAERTDILAYIVITATLSGLIYSVSVRWTWGGGWITQLDPPFHDFAGSGVVHSLGGAAALAGSYVVGPRLGRWTKPEEFVPHSVPQVLSGVLLLWVGWYGFNPGSTGTMSSSSDARAASNAAMTTTISAASSGMIIMSYHLYQSSGRNIYVMQFANGVLSGLVAVTAGCDVYTPWGAVAVGTGAAAVYLLANKLEVRCQIDDVVDAAAVHGASGAWGCLCVGFFHPTDGFVTNMLLGQLEYDLLISQCIGTVALLLLGGVPMFFLCIFLNKFNYLRASEEEENMGLDLYVFQLSAYTVDIKSQVEKIVHQARSGAPLQGFEDADAFPVKPQSRNAREPEGIEIAEKIDVPKQDRGTNHEAAKGDKAPDGTPYENHIGRNIPMSVSVSVQPAKKVLPFVGATPGFVGEPPKLLIPQPSPPSNAIAKFDGSKPFIMMIVSIQVAVIVTLILLQLQFESTYESKTGSQVDVKEATLALQLYNYYIGVALMMFVGFGYLMTFLRWYGLGAVGLTMLITCLGVETALISQAIVAFLGGDGAAFEVDLMALLQANFAVAAFLISFGGLIGKVNPPQLVIMVVCETVFYTANKYVLDDVLEVSDVGGSIVIHMFGAYFGLVLAYILGVPAVNLKEKASYVSDMFSLLGTVILWVYWPSFVAGATPAGTPDAELQLVQTILALAASTVSTFAMSALLSEDGKLRPVDVQNATLAGGVSIGILASTPLTAAGAIIVGSAAGTLSAFGFARISPYLYDTIGLHDTCGIHNLHGMPSVFGALCSVFIPYIFPNISKFDPITQMEGILLTLGVAAATGMFTAKLMKCFADGVELGSDIYYWEVADDFAKVAEKDALELDWEQYSARAMQAEMKKMEAEMEKKKAALNALGERLTPKNGAKGNAYLA